MLIERHMSWHRTRQLDKWCPERRVVKQACVAFLREGLSKSRCLRLKRRTDVAALASFQHDEPGHLFVFGIGYLGLGLANQLAKHGW